MYKVCIHPDSCKSCGLCIKACPKKILVVSKNINKLGYYPVTVTNMEACTGCTLCVTACPDLALEVKEDDQ